MMKVVSKSYRGKYLKVVYDSPCDSCKRNSQCLREAMYCSAFQGYINTGWYEISKVGKRLKKL